MGQQAALDRWLPGEKVEIHEHSGGDGGIDLQTPAGGIDVKTARKPTWLWVEKIRTDIYVLCKNDGKTPEVEFLGWETGADMLKCPQKKTPAGIVAYERPNWKLRDMKELDWYALNAELKAHDRPEKGPGSLDPQKKDPQPLPRDLKDDRGAKTFFEQGKLL